VTLKIILMEVTDFITIIKLAQYLVFIIICGTVGIIFRFSLIMEILSES